MDALIICLFKAIGWRQRFRVKLTAERKGYPDRPFAMFGSYRLYPRLLLRALNMPQVKRVIPVRRIFHVLRFERFPVVHIEVVRHDP